MVNNIMSTWQSYVKKNMAPGVTLKSLAVKYRTQKGGQGTQAKELKSKITMGHSSASKEPSAAKASKEPNASKEPSAAKASKEPSAAKASKQPNQKR